MKLYWHGFRIREAAWNIVWALFFNWPKSRESLTKCSSAYWMGLLSLVIKVSFGAELSPKNTSTINTIWGHKYYVVSATETLSAENDLHRLMYTTITGYTFNFLFICRDKYRIVLLFAKGIVYLWVYLVSKHAVLCFELSNVRSIIAEYIEIMN